VTYFGASSSSAGDPGLFSTLRSVGGVLGRNLPIVGPGIRAAEGLRGIFQRPGGKKIGGVPKIGAFVAGESRATSEARFRQVQMMAGMPRKRRRMNAGNAKALKRAIRRTDAFVKLSKDALKNTGWTVVSKSSLASSRAKAKGRPHHHHR